MLGFTLLVSVLPFIVVAVKDTATCSYKYGDVTPTSPGRSCWILLLHAVQYYHSNCDLPRAFCQN